MKKGFTLIELVTTLVILSIIALIVTPNILVSIKDYKKQVYDTNLGSIKSAAMSWAADNVNDTHFPIDEETSLLVTVQELIDSANLEPKITDPINGGTFDDEDHDTFVIINCTNIVDEITGEVKNRKYSYNVYISKDDLIEQSAIKYAEDNNLKNNITVKVSDLKGKYIKNNIYNTDKYINKNGIQKKDIADTITITITYNGKEYKVVVK